MAARKAREANPQTQLAELVRGIEREGLAHAYLLRGDERYFRDRALDAIKARAVADGLDVRMHDGEDPDFSPARLMDDLGGSGLFAARQLVVARGVEKELPKTAKEESALLDKLLAFLGGSDVGTLVVSVGALRADHKLAKAIAAAGGGTMTSRKLYDSPPPWGSSDPRRVELVEWLVGRAREMGMRMTPDQAVYVCAATGNDLFALEDQIAKLRDAPRDADLQALLGWEATASPWQVAGDMVEGNLANALAGIETLFRGGFTERDGRRLVDAAGLAQILISGLLGSVRKGLAIATAVERGASPSEAARAAGLAGAPAVVQREIERAAKHGSATWRARLEDMADLERRSKSTGGVEVDDFALLAVRWRDPSVRPIRPIRVRPGARR
jgi:DNA polymerase III delta subunit